MSLYLYYDSKKGLVKEENHAMGSYFIQEHNERGMNEQTMELPNSNVKIVVRTKANSFMVATISIMDKIVLNFHDTTLSRPIHKVSVKPGDWNALFDGIIQLYNSIYISETPINAYFDTIDEKLNKTKSISYETINNVSSRLAEISDKIQGSIYCDSLIVKQRMKKACKIMVRTLINYGIEGLITDIKHKTIEANLKSITKYLADQDMMFDVLVRKNHVIIEKDEEK